MNAKPKLVYLIGQFPAINHGYLLAEVRHLRGLGFDIEVVSVSPPDRPLDALSDAEREEADRTYYLKSLSFSRILWLNAAEFLQHPFGYLRGLAGAVGLAGAALGRIPYYLAYLAEAVALGRRMRALNTNHVHASFSATVALIASKIFPITWSFGVYGFGELHDPSASHLRERIESAQFVRSISKFGKGQMMLSCAREQWEKLVYSPLGIDPDEFTPTPRSPVNGSSINLLCVGRLSEEKGQALLIDAVSALRKRDVAVQLHFVGDGPDRQSLQERAQQCGVAAQVFFEGWISQPRLMELYSGTDIFVLSSLAEGIPMVLMEAMALEKPCVAPCIAGIPELIEHGISGLLFSVADVADLAEKLRILAESPELRLQMGKKARQRVVRDYDMTKNAVRFAGLLEQQLERITAGKS